MYTNSRLKHVKKIEEICSETLYALGTPAHITLIEMQIKAVVKQCNLLLETKKKKKWCKCPTFMEIDGICNRCMLPKKDYFQPSPQPEIEKVAENDGEWCTGGKVSITYGQREEMLREKLNEVIDQLNKLTKTKND